VAQQPSQEDTTISALFNRLKESGESAFNKLSEQLLENPVFMSAFRRAVEAKGQVDRTVSGTMDFMNLPEELQSLSAQVTRQQKVITSLEHSAVQLNAAVAQLLARLDRPGPGE
jgi:hypothetical protein